MSGRSSLFKRDGREWGLITGKYVAAAVLYAWAAECYARNEEDSKAEEAAVQMYDNLKGASDLCSDAPSVGPPTECDTIRIFGCNEL